MFACLRLRSGLVSSLGAGVVSGALVAAANAFSPRFRGALGVSGKAALVVTPTVGAFSLASHLSIGNVAKDGGTSIAGAAAAAPVAKVSSLPLWCRAANMVYINPFKTILGICAPAYGALFYRESTHPATANMLLSQRLIHTRVYGQALALTLTLTFTPTRTPTPTPTLTLRRRSERHGADDGHRARGRRARPALPGQRQRPGAPRAWS